MYRQWLFKAADSPVKYNLDRDSVSRGDFLQNAEVSSWLARLAARSQDNNIGEIHGSHDYRM